MNNQLWSCSELSYSCIIQEHIKIDMWQKWYENRGYSSGKSRTTWKLVWQGEREAIQVCVGWLSTYFEVTQGSSTSKYIHTRKKIPNNSLSKILYWSRKVLNFCMWRWAWHGHNYNYLMIAQFAGIDLTKLNDQAHAELYKTKTKLCMIITVESKKEQLWNGFL